MSTNNNDDIVYVPIPQRLLPTFYRMFPTVMEEAARQAAVAEPVSATEQRNLNVIDLGIKAAYEIGADRHPISLAELHDAYLRANPGIGKGLTRNSFDATINFHCINMRARFPDPANKQKHPAPWLTHPAFKRVARGRYMLLSPDEFVLFRQHVEENDPRVYADEYSIEDLR
jgi:hypothetical protein